MSSPPGDAAAAPQRLFLALWPDDAVRRQLARVRDAAVARLRDGTPVSLANLHATLVFLGATAPPRRQCAEWVVEAVTAAPFTLVLDTAGCFARAGVYWIGARTTPAVLTELVADLQRALAACGCVIDPRPYTPHVTLLRKCRAPKHDTVLESPVVWPVSRFHLVESLTLPRGA
jgi:RNA 2',3'-cyclic 3'-phosphodiesterase